MNIQLFYALLIFAIPAYFYAFVAKEVADKMLFSLLAISLCTALAATSLSLETVSNGVVIDISSNTVGILFTVFAVAPVINVYRYLFGKAY